jgi:transposase
MICHVAIEDNEAFQAMKARLADLLPRLNERDRRLALAVEAKSWGRGGISAVRQATGASKTTIRRGITELDNDPAEGSSDRVRAPGGGRKKSEVTDPELLNALENLIEPETRGDPESPLRWTTKSTRKLAEGLTEAGHSISHTAVAKLLHFLGYSLQSTRKKMEGSQHPDRDDQFRYINKLATELLAAGDPVISVDTKKKELVGQFAQTGKEWHPQGEPVDVSTYDFPDQADGKAIPYGVYDLTDNSAWVSVGIDHDTSVFAVATIEKWWQWRSQVVGATLGLTWGPREGPHRATSGQAKGCPTRGPAYGPSPQVKPGVALTVSAQAPRIARQFLIKRRPHVRARRW